MKLVALQSWINGLWLLFHRGKQNYTNAVQGFQHTRILNSWVFCLIVIVLGIALMYAAIRNKAKMQRWTLIFMNATWSFYTVVLFINEINGVPNMSWALFLGYNMAIYISARYEVDNT